MYLIFVLGVNINTEAFNTDGCEQNTSFDFSPIYPTRVSE
jgi:hypothetical protein